MYVAIRLRGNAKPLSTGDADYVVIELVSESSSESKTRSQETKQRSTYDVPY